MLTRILSDGTYWFNFNLNAEIELYKVIKENRTENCKLCFEYAVKNEHETRLYFRASREKSVCFLFYNKHATSDLHGKDIPTAILSTMRHCHINPTIVDMNEYADGQKTVHRILILGLLQCDTCKGWLPSHLDTCITCFEST